MAFTKASVETLTNVTLCVGAANAANAAAVTGDVGFLEDGVTYKVSIETTEVKADQNLRPLLLETTTITRTVEAVLLEHTLAQLADFVPGVADGATVTYGEEPTKYVSVKITGTKRDTVADIVIFLPRCAVISNVERKFSCKSGAIKIPVMFQECYSYDGEGAVTYGTQAIAGT